MIRHLFWNRSRDCSVCTTWEEGVLRRTPAQMFQHTWFLFCLFGVEGVKRTAKSSLPLEIGVLHHVASRTGGCHSRLVTGTLHYRNCPNVVGSGNTDTLWMFWQSTNTVYTNFNPADTFSFPRSGLVLWFWVLQSSSLIEMIKGAERVYPDY